MERLEQQASARVAVIPLLGNEQTDDALWLGAVLARLLAKHLDAGPFTVVDYNVVAEQLARDPFVLPLDAASVDAVLERLKAQALVHGRYILDETGRMLGFRLLVEAPNIPHIPLEVSTPLPEFSRFIERVSLALIEQLGAPIDDALRQRLARIVRPASFEALHQLARAYAAWSRRQNELALAAVTSSLAIDPQYEEAAALEVAIARTASDTQTTRAAFRRWSSLAEKQGQPIVAAERLLMLGHWLMEHGEWEEARRAYDDTRSLFLRQKHEYGEAQAINNLANLEMLRGKYQNAIGAYRRNLRILQDDPHRESDRAQTLYNLSLAHKNLGQREEAKRAVEEAMSEASRLQDQRLEAYCLVQRGALNDDMGQWAQAASDYAQAARLLDALGDEKTLAQVKTHQAILFKQQGDYNRAEALLRQALPVFEQAKDSHELAVLWVNLADLCLSISAYDQAWDYAERAVDVLTGLKSGWLDRAQDILDTLDAVAQISAPATEAEPDTPPLSDTSLNVSETVTIGPRHTGQPGFFDNSSPSQMLGGTTEESSEDDDDRSLS